MPLDPRLALAVKTPDISKTFGSILTNVGEMQRQKQSAELQPFREQLLKSQAQQTQQNALSTRDTARLKSLGNFALEVLPSLREDNPQEALSLAKSRLARMQQTIADNPGIQLDTTETQQFIDLLESGDGMDQLTATQRAEQAAQLAQSQGLLNNQGISAGQREFANALRIAQDPNSTEIERNSALVKLGQRPRASSSAQERIVSDPNLRNKVIDFQGDLTSTKETAKQEKQLKFKPLIQSAVKQAEADAKERGEVLTDLKRSEAALPGLLEVTGKLKDLAKVATVTTAGKVVDFLAKESGFGATKGATARAKFQAIIDNQVLPLLKPTFGAAFTVQEGESLKATLGDVNATAEEKSAQIDAFIEQKMRDIRTKQTQLDQTGQPQQTPQQSQFKEGQTATDASGNKIIFTNGQWVSFNG